MGWCVSPCLLSLLVPAAQPYCIGVFCSWTERLACWSMPTLRRGCRHMSHLKSWSMARTRCVIEFKLSCLLGEACTFAFSTLHRGSIPVQITASTLHSCQQGLWWISTASGSVAAVAMPLGGRLCVVAC
jgi:hypothetical protein